MHKSGIYLAIGVGLFAVIVAVGILVVCYKSSPAPDDLLARYRDGSGYETLTIHYPLNETLFPPEIVPPAFRWEDENTKSNMWLLSIRFQDSNIPMNIITHESEWTPQQQQWETIKKRSLENETWVNIFVISRRITTIILSAGKILIKMD